ncbi:hypothetical protein JCM15124A_03100 [Prevotella falsenii]
MVALCIAMLAMPTKMHAQEKYDLIIAGEQVTAKNCNDLSVISGVKGSVRYYPKNKILWLENAGIEATGEAHGISSKIKGLMIVVRGDNTISADGGAAINTENAYCTLTGKGKMKLHGKSFGLHATNNAGITIDGCTIESDGSIGAEKGNTEITIIRAYITAKGSTHETMRGIMKFTLEDCEIMQPAGAAYDAALKGIAANGQLVKDKVVIESIAYPLAIAGKSVTTKNYNNLSQIDGVAGTVKYDPQTKTLTLENATIMKEENGPKAISVEIPDFTLKVIGNNYITSKGSTFTVAATATVTGGGTLNVQSLDNCAVFVNQTSLTIKDCTVNAKGYQFGFAGWDGNSNEQLNIDNAMVTAEGKEHGSICDFASLTLTKCVITQPIGAVYDTKQHFLAVNGQKVRGKVVISNDPAAISSPTADTAVVQGVYSLSGVRLSEDLNSLPKGIYIVDGKKVVKQ